MFNYYCSNYGKVLEADKIGWWIAYDTESTDHGAVHVPSKLLPSNGKINNDKEALKILEAMLDYEWDSGYFYASVNHYGFCSEVK